MDSNRYVRSRTSSTSSLPATPAHTPNIVTINRATNHGVFQSFQQVHPFSVSPDLLAANLSRVRAEQGSRGSSIPPTPAPTPNLLLHNHMVPEQLVAGIKQLRADEGYIESSSFPATPAPSPFSPSPAQFSEFCPDQVAESIRKLREEDSVSSEVSTGQPPTPSTTPGPAPRHQVIAPEHLAESIQHLRFDEGVESTSNPATPIPTPISPLCINQSIRTHQILPEQLAAGIHRLKVEEGMSSGGSSGFPSTPAPTPFTYHPGGVRPEDLAAGISRLSVIEEGDSLPNQTPQQRVSIRVEMDEASCGEQETDNQPNLSQYFSDPGASSSFATPSITFFDQLEATTNSKTGGDNHETSSMLHSCRPSRVDLPNLDDLKIGSNESEAKLEVSQQTFDDAKSLQRRQSQEGAQHRVPQTPKVEGVVTPPPSTNEVVSPEPSHLQVGDQRPPPPTSLPQFSDQAKTPGSVYATPVAPSPIVDSNLGVMSLNASALFLSNVPITSPLPNAIVAVALPPVLPTRHDSIGQDDEGLPAEVVRRRDAWIPSAATRRMLEAHRMSRDGVFADRSSLTSPRLHFTDTLQDPIRGLISHYRGESEASKRVVLGVDSVSQDEQGLRQLIDAGCYRAALNLTTRLLLQLQQGNTQSPFVKHSAYSLQLWYTRLSLMVKLKQFSNVEVEAEPFGDLDKPDMYHEFYPEIDPLRKGSLVPFQFRLLLAELKQYLGQHPESLDRLYALLATVDNILVNLNNGSLEDGTKVMLAPSDKLESIEFWKARRLRVLYAIANCAISQKDFDLSGLTMEMIFKEETVLNQPKVKSSLGRLFLQLGDLVSAGEQLECAKQLRKAILEAAPQNVDADAAEFEIENLLDEAFMSIAGNNYIEALGHLQAADKIRPGQPAVINNISVCLLYLGRLKEAISVLESNLTSNPQLFLQESPVLNLATLYELESSFAHQKKLALLDLMSQFAGDGVNTGCLKF